MNTGCGTRDIYFNTGKPVSDERRCQIVQPSDSFGSVPPALISSETGHRRRCRRGCPEQTNKFITVTSVTVTVTVGEAGITSVHMDLL